MVTRAGLVASGMMVLALGLAGCALAPEDNPPARTPDKPPIPRPLPRPAARPDPPPAVSIPAPVPVPPTLQGLSEAEVTRLLGRPDQTDTQAMATTWRYRRSGCVLALVFFPEVDSDTRRVLSWEAEKGEAEACLKRLTAKGKSHAP